MRAIASARRSPAKAIWTMVRILSAALASGTEAIHPGYGFLSENAAFAALCQKYQHRVYRAVGPKSSQMLSDKAAVKAHDAAGRSAGHPRLRLTLHDAASARTAAEKIGYPVMLKACMGGGGRGIRLVESPAQMEAAFLSAHRREPESPSATARCIWRSTFTPPEHIEVQVLADEYGNVVCLGERDCSVQRNHQKLIEESPSPGITPAQRGDLTAPGARGRAAVGLCRCRDAWSFCWTAPDISILWR